MKKYVLIINVLMLGIKSNAQENFDEKVKAPIKVQSIIEVGYSAGFHNTQHYHANRLLSYFDHLSGIYYSALFFRNPYMHLGAGAGFECKKGVYILPTFMDGRLDLFLKKKFQPIILMSWGYSHHWGKEIYPTAGKTGFEFTIGIGVKAKLNKKNSFTLSMGYKLYEVQYNYYNSYAGDYGDFGYNYIFVKGGIIFNHSHPIKPLVIEKEY